MDELAVHGREERGPRDSNGAVGGAVLRVGHLEEHHVGRHQHAGGARRQQEPQRGEEGHILGERERGAGEDEQHEPDAEHGLATDAVGRYARNLETASADLGLRFDPDLI